MIQRLHSEPRPNGTTIDTIKVTYQDRPEDNHDTFEVNCPVCANRFEADGDYADLGWDEMAHIGSFFRLREAREAADSHRHESYFPRAASLHVPAGAIYAMARLLDMLAHWCISVSRHDPDPDHVRHAWEIEVATDPDDVPLVAVFHDHLSWVRWAS